MANDPSDTTSTDPIDLEDVLHLGDMPVAGLPTGEAIKLREEIAQLRKDAATRENLMKRLQRIADDRRDEIDGLRNRLAERQLAIRQLRFADRNVWAFINRLAAGFSSKWFKGTFTRWALREIRTLRDKIERENERLIAEYQSQL